MSSLMTNASAMTALATLQLTNQQLDQTQNQISTGYKVSQASDNAAYWSIATTMRSDNNSLSTVNDALGLGSATVDTAYTAMTSVQGVMDKIKADLVTASQPGVDKSKIQSEIAQYQSQIQTIASSAAFSGSNWLSVNSSASSYNATQKVVASFNRDSSNNVSIGTIDVDISKVSLFDAASGKYGLLQAGTAGQGTSAAFAYSAGDIDDGGKFTVAVKVDGGSAQNIAVTVADHTTFTLDDLVTGLNASLTGAKASAVNGKLVLTSNTTGTSSSVEITGVTAKKADGTTNSTASVGFTTMAAATGAATGGGIMDIDVTNATADQLAAYTSNIDAMYANVTTAAANLGSVKTRIDLQTTFVGNLMDSIDKGVGALVDADMDQASTRLKALQTQQQLGIQALSIANSSSQNILSLFRS